MLPLTRLNKPLTKRHTAMDYVIMAELIERVSLGEVLFMLAEISDNALLDPQQTLGDTLDDSEGHERDNQG